MVPVKKPGRPLTACPHLQPNTCGCSSITAAIPRKSQCGCGPANKTIKTEPQPVTSPIPETPSPTTVDFKVKKASQARSRKPSYDPSIFEKMDPSSVNVIPFVPQRTQQLIAPARPYKPAIPQVPFFDEGQKPVFQQTQSPPLAYSAGSPYLSNNGNGGYAIANGDGVNAMYRPFEPLPEALAISPPNSTSPSCCGPKNGIKVEYDDHQPKQTPSSCCSKETSDAAINGMSFASNNQTPMSSPFPYPPAYPVDAALYGTYPQQTTVYAYPASYGSYLNPLQPSEWRQSVVNNMYAQPAQPVDSLNSLNNLYAMPPANVDISTLHSCGCGPTCQCIGCAAHPYNNATQEYVRSAYKGLREPLSPASNLFSNSTPPYNAAIFSASDSAYPSDKDYMMPARAPKYPSHNNGNGNGENQQPSPVAESPSISDAGTSTGGEEQTLSASDFFFVNYPISGDGCGGDTTSCPCGDDCQCLGCTIHRLDEPEGLQGLGDLGNLAGLERNGEELGGGARMEEMASNGEVAGGEVRVKNSCCS